MQEILMTLQVPMSFLFLGPGQIPHAPDNDCIKRKAALMGEYFAILAQDALEHIRGVFDSELTFRKLLWNRAAHDWNKTCVPLGYPIIEVFFELGPRKL